MITMGGGRSPCNWRISCAALKAVEIGHAPIHQHHVVATALGHRRLDPRHRLAAAADAVGARQPGADRAFEQLAGHQVVVRHQQPQRFAGPGAGRRSGWSWATSRSRSNQNRLPLPGALSTRNSTKPSNT